MPPKNRKNSKSVVLARRGPENWCELPLTFWVVVFKYLSVNDIQNLHLVSRQFHELTNLFPQTLYINYAVYKDKFNERIGNMNRSLDAIKIKGFPYKAENFEKVLQKISKDPCQITLIELRDIKLNKVVFMEMIHRLPNLKSLTLFFATNEKRESTSFPYVSIKSNEKIILPHLEFLEFSNCNIPYQKILNNIVECKLSEGVFTRVTETNLKQFLKKQQKNLKKLTLHSYISRYENTLTRVPSMKLEYLKMTCHCSDVTDSTGQNFLNFLKQHTNLKTLILKSMDVNDNIINLICDTFENLEVLEIEIENNDITIDSFNKLYCLRKLRKLTILDHKYYKLTFNTLQGLQTAVNLNLEEIDAPFIEISSDFIQHFKYCIPNLKRLAIRSTSASVINEVVKNFPDLEYLLIDYEYVLTFNQFQQPYSLEKKFLFNLKHLVIERNNLQFELSTINDLINSFPNLECLSIGYCRKLNDSSVEVLLSGLKNLKELHLKHLNMELTNLTINHIKQHGRQLKIIDIDGDFDFEYTRRSLKKLKGLEFSCRKFKIEN